MFGAGSVPLKTEHGQGHDCSWDVPPKLQDENHGQVVRECFAC